MKKLQVIIREKEKQIHSFNLYNFRDEIVNFMYKKTVAESSRNSMVFYLALFFLFVKGEKKSLLEELLETNIQKVEKLNEKLSSFDKLEKGQYAELVEEAGLKEVFQFDVFFAIIVAFNQFEEIKTEFDTYFKANPTILQEFERLNQLYSEKLNNFFDHFEKNMIEDDRVGYTGDYLDLSKSVYRTIKMRSSRRIDLTLHKYAEVKEISSSSPIVVEIIQNIDPQVVVNIWDAYNLGEYVKGAWKLTDEHIVNNWFFQGIAGAAGYDAAKWLRWKLINGSKNRKEKNAARVEFKESLDQKREEAEKDPIQEALANSVMASNDYLQNEVKELRIELKTIREQNSLLVDQNKRIKELEDKIEKLENVEVEVKELN